MKSVITKRDETGMEQKMERKTEKKGKYEKGGKA